MKCVYLSGYDKNNEILIENRKDFYLTFDESDIAKLETTCELKDFTGIDLLLTSQWPKNIEKYVQPLVIYYKLSNQNK